MTCRIPGLPTLALAMCLCACGGGNSGNGVTPPPPPPPPATAASVSVSAGDQQQAAARTAVSAAPAVLVRDASNNPVAGVTVQFTVAAGGGTLEGAAPVTDASGIARVGKWTLGPNGEQRLSATVGSLAAIAFLATITPGTEAFPVVLGSSGGALEITTAGHPFLGFKLTVPAGTFFAPGAVEVRSLGSQQAPTLPAGYQAVGPMMEISTDQPRGLQLMTIDVPVTRPAGRDVVIVLRDPARGVMEVMPTVSRTASSVRVMTMHLRADLLLGRSIQPGLFSLTSARQAGSLAQLIPVSMLIPLAPAGPVLNTTTDRWPLLDHGAALFPNGLTGGIAALQAGAKAFNTAQLSSLVKPLATPGFYAEKGQLAAAVVANSAVTGSTSVFAQMIGSMASLTKDVRDELVHHNMVASLALASGPVTVALYSPGSQLSHFANVIAGTSTDLTLLNPGSTAAVTWARSVTTGYAAIAMSVTADKPQVTVDQALPVSSFTTAFGQIATVLQDLTTLASLSVAARDAKNDAMAAQAGIPDVPVEVQPLPGSPFQALQGGTVVARTNRVTIRVPTLSGSAGFVLNIPGSGSEAARVQGTTLPLSSITNYATLPNLVPTDFVASPFAQVGGVLRQISAKLITVVKAPFDVTPATSTHSVPFTNLSFTASVPMPPATYLIDWDWGDGQFEAHTGSTTASHQYSQVKDYKVIATLRSLPSTDILAADTVDVTVDQAMHWRLTSFTDVDDMLTDEDDEIDAPAPLLAALQRAVAAPTSALISVMPQTVTTSRLELRIDLKALWNPLECCPPPTYHTSEYDLPLGADPSVNYTVGPYFAGFDISYIQMPPTLGAGTVRAQYVDGTHLYTIKNVGTQVGPAGTTRTTATLNGTTMTGTISIIIWFIDDLTGEVESAPTEFRFNFTAVRLR